jgi:hypothetical protein
MTDTDNQRTLGRNEPCPCRSGKKYKRCCGIAAAPKLSVSTKQASNTPSNMGMDPSALEGMNPEVLMQFTQALQRLPKGQIQKFQSIMQKAMSGKDVTKEAAEFEKTLPVEFQAMMQSMGAMGMGGAGGAPDANAGFDLGALGLPSGDLEPQALEAPLSEEKARALVAKAAAEGKITQEQAEALLKVEPQLQDEIRQKARGEKYVASEAFDETNSETPVEQATSSEILKSSESQASGDSKNTEDSKFKKMWKNLSKSR